MAPIRAPIHRRFFWELSLLTGAGQSPLYPAFKTPAGGMPRHTGPCVLVAGLRQPSFGPGLWFQLLTPLLALAYAAIASTERLLTRLQRCLATLTGSRSPWLQILPMLLLAVLAVFGSGLACSLSEPVAEFIVALFGPCRLSQDLPSAISGF